MFNLVSIKFTQLYLLALFVLPTLSNIPQPLQLTVRMLPTGQSSQIGRLANQFVKPEDRIMNYHLGMSKQHQPIPQTRIQEAALLNQKPLDRIQNVANQLNRSEVKPGELVYKMQKDAKKYTQGKMSNSAVAEGKLVGPTALEMDKKKKEQHIFEKEKKKKEEDKIALAATKVALEEMKKEKKKVIKEAIKEVKKEMKLKQELKKMMHGNGHNHHHKKDNKNGKPQTEHQKLKKANQSQAGFMAIVTHKIYKESKNKLKGPIPKLKYPKDLHNLLWTAVSLAREQLVEGKTNSPICLLEFLARMVGGAFAPFVDRKNEKYMRGPHGFLHKISNHETAFLSSGYMAFWREKLGTKRFEEYEKSVNPVFINHEF